MRVVFSCRGAYNFVTLHQNVSILAEITRVLAYLWAKLIHTMESLR